jgi:predicted component of type VI protein secretion system
MSLVLRGLALNDEAMSRPLVGRFDERGGKIGRSDNVTFTLPDPERLISRVQAEIRYADEGYWIENVSAANPILHNGRPLSSGMRVPLHEGDEIRIGGYTLQVAFENDLTSATILRGRTDAVAPPGAPRPGPAAPAAAPAARAARAARAAPAAPAVPEAPRVERVPVEPAAADALWRGFLEGAGISLPLPNGPTPELMQLIGSMMKIAVEGIHHLVSMRAVAKSEMHAEMTMIQVRGNNPLKFAPDAVIALQLLLQPPARGFLPGPAALRDALVDLQSHQVGVMAGMRSALEAVLDRFDPAQLEAQLSSRSVLDALVPAHRRARLWELYLEHYHTLRDEAQEDFHRLFGAAFLEAYEEQVRSLESAGAPAGAPGEPKR